jgi:hypothetical protein
MNSDAHLIQVVWRKSSYSNGDGGNCLEVADWRKSSYSNGEGGECLEVADTKTAFVPVRDSKSPGGPVLRHAAGGWAAFIGAVKAGTIART